MKARTQTSYLFDLDGTLVDSVYDHVMAWSHALHEANLEVSLRLARLVDEFPLPDETEPASVFTA